MSELGTRTVDNMTAVDSYMHKRLIILSIITDYRYYYVPENVAPGQQQLPVLRSPLAGRLE